MAHLNKIMLIGNLGKDPDIKVTQSGTKKASISIATTERFRDKNTSENKDQTEWHNLVFWGSSAELVERLQLRKGISLYIEGKQTHRSYDDQSGQKRYVSEVVVHSFQILTPRSAQGHGGGYDAGHADGENVPQASQSDYGVGGDDDLPF